MDQMFPLKKAECMKIVVIGKLKIEMMAQHIAQNFEAMGHTVIPHQPGVDYAPKAGNLWKRWIQIKRLVHDLSGKISLVRRWRNQNLIEKLQETSPDLVVSCHDFLSPEEVDAIREQVDTGVVLWFPDGMANFGNAMFLGADYDAMFFKDPYLIQYLDGKLETPVYYLPQCFYPEKHSLGEEGITAVDRRKYRCEVTTAGNLYAYRQGFFRQLVDYDVKIWGAPPPTWMQEPAIMEMYQGEYVYDEIKAKAFLGAKVLLNNMHPHEVYGLNKRAFEACGIGAFQILDWTPGLPQLFELGEEVVVFRDMVELKRKLNHYLEDDEARQRIARAGKRRAMEEHTYRDRLELMLETIFGDAEGYPMPDIEVNT